MNGFKAWWKRISKLGVEPDQSPQLSGSIMLSNQVAIIVGVFFILYLFIELLFPPPQPVIDPIYFYGIQAVMIFLLCLVLVLNFQKQTLVARLLFCLLLPISLLPNSFALSQPLRAEFYMYGLAGSSFLFFSQKRYITILFLVPVVIFYIMVYNVQQKFPTVYVLDFGTILRIGLSFANIYIAMNLLRGKNNRYESELQDLNKTKDKLLSIVSHDLRSPIGSLRTLLQMLDSSQISQDEFKQLLGKLHTKVDSLHATLENLLHWSYSQSTGMKIKPEVCMLNNLIEESIQLLKHNADLKRISLLAQGDLKIDIFADVTMIRSTLINLLSNAIKFTPGDGVITILAAQEKNSMLRITIQDTGRGMTKEMADSLFQPGTHFSLPGTDNEQGTGLGLQLCKEFVEKNHGKISVISEPGKGSQFSFTVPLASNLIYRQ